MINNKDLSLKDIAVFGAGGFGREVACLINWINRERPTWNFIGFFDDGVEKGTANEYGTVLGGMAELNAWQGDLAVVIAIGTPRIVRIVQSKITKADIEYPNLIAPNVVFLDRDNVRMGKGNIICTSCMLSCNVELGDFNILNSYIPVGHDTTIGSYNVVMPSVNISGGVIIGDENFFGVQSVVLQYLKIGNRTRVGAGSVVMRKTQDDNLYLGNPATKVKFA